MFKIVDNTTSRSLPVYKFTGFQEILLGSVILDEDFIRELKHCLAVGHFRDHPWIYYLCFFKDKEGSLDLYPLPLLFEKENEQELTAWLTSCKQSLLAAIED